MTGFALRAVIAALGLWIATRLVGGLHIDNPTTLLLAGVLLGLINAIVRPIAVVLTLPLTLVTLGLFLLVVNAAMLGLVSVLLPGMRIEGFGAALATWLIVAVTGWVGSWFIGARGRIEIIRRD
jgi:putative membrane protein